jgi:hypothetical protein
MAYAPAGRVVRVSSNDDGGNQDHSQELFAVAVDNDQGALDAFHEQFMVVDDGVEIVGPLRQGSIMLLMLDDGQATPL